MLKIKVIFCFQIVLILLQGKTMSSLKQLYLKYEKVNKINDTNFHFATNVDGTYLEIAENGDLLNKDKNGNTIEVFKKKVFKY